MTLFLIILAGIACFLMLPYLLFSTVNLLILIFIGSVGFFVAGLMAAIPAAIVFGLVKLVLLAF